VAWIESHQSLAKHRKTIRAAGRLSVDRATLIGHLHFLWWWGLDNVGADGRLGDMTAYEIAAAAEWPGDPEQFLAALIEAGFIDDTPDGLVLHDWYDYAGKLIERREAERERSRQRRATRQTSEGQPAGNRATTGGRPADGRATTGGTVPNLTVPNLTIHDQTDRTRAHTREDGRPNASPQPPPSDSPSSPVGGGGLPEPHDGMGIEDVVQRYHQHIGIMSPGLFHDLDTWHTEHGMSYGALAAAIDEVAKARAEGRIRGSPDSYLRGTVRGMYNDGIRTVADIRERARVDPRSPDYDTQEALRRRLAEVEALLGEG